MTNIYVFKKDDASGLENASNLGDELEVWVVDETSETSAAVSAVDAGERKRTRGQRRVSAGSIVDAYRSK